MEFEWDINKAHTNLKKHAVSFDEAQTVFDDPLACIFDDEWHSFGEARELIIGHSSNNRLLIVSFTELLPSFVVSSELSAHGRQRHKSVRHMKSTESTEQNDDMLAEYSFDYSKAKPNRFAKQSSNVTTIVLDPDVAKVFTTSEAVNKALRAILAALPNSQLPGKV